jgi:hypothetical protein
VENLAATSFPSLFSFPLFESERLTQTLCLPSRNEVMLATQFAQMS